MAAISRPAFLPARDVILQMVPVSLRSIPRLAGQHAEYTASQLRAFRTEERANDVNKVMHTIATRMSEREMQAVSEFIAGLR